MLLTHYLYKEQQRLPFFVGVTRLDNNLLESQPSSKYTLSLFHLESKIDSQSMHLVMRLIIPEEFQKN